MTREEFDYAIKSCGCFIYRGQTYYEESELIKAFEDLGLIHIELEQEPTDENLHREREQAYMQGYEDASKKYRQEPCEDAISRQGDDRWLLHFGQNMAIPSAEPKTGHWIGIDEEPHEDWECDNCGFVIWADENIEKFHYCPNCGAKMDEMVEPQERSE